MTPQKAAGCRMLPPVSVPSAMEAAPAATAAAEPPLLPPARHPFRIPGIPRAEIGASTPSDAQ